MDTSALVITATVIDHGQWLGTCEYIMHTLEECRDMGWEAMIGLAERMLFQEQAAEAGFYPLPGSNDLPSCVSECVPEGME